MTVVVALTIALFIAAPHVARTVAGLIERHRPTDEAPDFDDKALLAELTALGLSAGLSFPGALEAASAHLSDEAARTVRRILRFPGRVDDLGVAADLIGLADRALVTGAPLLGSIHGYAMSLRRERRAAAIERARRLPVKLLFPLALLILPGFLILTVGPALLAGLDRLSL